MKTYKYVKTWMDDGKRRVVRADEEDIVWMKYLKARYGFGGCQSVVDMTVAEWIEIAVPQYKQNVAKRTYQDYNATIKKWVLPIIGDKDLASVTHSDCQTVLNQLQGKSKRTIAGMQQILDFIFKSAIWNDYLTDNPAAYLVPPKGKEKQKRRALYPEERKALLDLFDSPMGYKFRLFAIMYYCGLRPSECWTITKSDIKKIDGHTILHVKGTKTGAADRYVPWPSTLTRYSTKAKKGDLICTTEFGTQYNKTSYRRLVERLYREMDIMMGAELYRNKIVVSILRQDFVPYNIRHDFCCRLKNSGIDIRHAQYLMGHSNISVTGDIYTHTDLDDVLRLSDDIVTGVTGVTSKLKK